MVTLAEKVNATSWGISMSVCLPRRAALRRPAAAGLALLTCLALVACDAEARDSAGSATERGAAGEPVPPTPVKLSTSLRQSASVPIDHRLRVDVQGAELGRVRVASSAGELSGVLDDGSWRATGRLEPGTDYAVRVTAERADGSQVRRHTRFQTVDLTLDQQVYASVAPLDGETVGVGMPVVVTFDLPVRDRAAFEREMSITSSPEQPGSWHWLNDQEAHWRPRSYWRPGTDVHVELGINSVAAGDGLFGQESRSIDFHVGSSVVSKVDVDAHVMRTFINGELARTIPVSAGKPGWETRSGTKVIIEKFRRKRMNASTIGVSEDDPEYYDLSNVQYALRVTYSGEFLHAAPWSAGSQGSANVSHGCVGMSLADAAWLYDRTHRGDVVEVSGSDRQMSLTNGYGDWNASFADYRAGSALH